MGSIIVVLLAVFAAGSPLVVADWDSYDWLIVGTGAFAAMACTIPGVFLLLKRQSMMGDALSHAVLPGVVAAVLISEGLTRAGWVSPGARMTWLHMLLFGGALALGVLSAVMTEWIQRLGRVEASAALGVVYTTLFAIGLLMIRRTADIHIDLDCVLYGNLATAQVGELLPIAGVFALNALLVCLFFKELKIAAFDPGLATTMGINARLVHYALMAITAATVVIAFERVGSILVIAMLIVPAATSFLLTTRLGPMIVISLLIAGACALVGHLSAILLPPLILPRLGFAELADASASTAGMMAVAAGCFFLLALLFSPGQGVVSRALMRLRLALKIAQEDVLGKLYRAEERRNTASAPSAATVDQHPIDQSLHARIALWRLRSRGKIVRQAAGYELTDEGRKSALKLVRSHRLWESYMAEHFELPEDHLHHTAEQVEHFIGPELRQALAEELDTPDEDPHGRSIPPAPE